MNQTFPYPGLRPFERDETDIFFGREDHTDQLLEKLGQNRFLAVVGPSGCGKSSLVRTGLLAGLEGGLLTSAGIYWHIAEMRPGNHPEAHLAEALLADSALGDDYIKHFTDKPEAVASLQATLRRGPLSLCELWQEAQFDTGTRLLLLVDQFEELFRYYQQGEVEETAAFVALLLASYQNPNIYVIITMRSDFIGDCAAFYGLPEAVNAGLYLTPRLTREQLAEAIALPATVFGGTIEQGLLNRLLNDAGNDPDQLPIIQHALMRMWQHAANAEEDVLTLAHYEQIGGFKKALSNHADKAYDELTAAQQKIAEILFRNLSERDSNKRDTRRPTQLREIARLAEVEWQAVVPVVEVFRKQGRHFLVPPVGHILEPDTVLDISHESLIRQWQRMQNWLNQEAESALLYQRVEETAQRWQAGKAALLRSPELEQVLAWRTQAQPTQAWGERYGQHFALAMAFLEESEQAQHQEAKAIQKRRRVTFAAMAGGLIIAIILTLISVFLGLDASQQRKKAEKSLVKAEASQAKAEAQKKEALAQKDKAEKQKREAQRNQSFALSALSEMERDKGNLTNAMLLALEGLPQNLSEPERPYVVEAEVKLSQAVFEFSENYSERFVMDGDNSIYHLAFSPNGTLIALAESGGAVHLWEATSGQRLHTLIGHTNNVNHVAFSPDGEILATASDDKTARLWAVKSGKLIQTLRGHTNWVMHATFSPDGGRLATASSDKTARLWAVKSGKLIQTLRGHENYVRHAAFSPDGGRLATASLDKTARLWAVKSGKLIQTLRGHTSSVWHAAFSPDGGRLATASDDNTARLWAVKSGKLIQTLRGHQDTVRHAAFSPDGGRLATASDDNTARLWDGQSGKLIQTLRGHENTVWHAAFSPDGGRLATASDDNTARLWEVKSGKLIQTLQGHENYVRHAAFSPDGGMLATASDDKTARIWPLLSTQKLIDEATKRVPRCLTPKQRQDFFLSDDPNGEWIENGEELAKTGQIQAAIEEFQRVQLKAPCFKFDPTDKARRIAATAALEKGKALAQQGQIQAAVVKFTEATTVDAHLKLEQPENYAIALAQQAAQEIIEKGEQLAQEGQLEEATTQFKAALAIDTHLNFEPANKTQGFVLVQQGEALAQEGKLEEATVKFKAAQALDSTLSFEPEIKAKRLLAPVLVEQGQQLAIKGQIEKAIADYQQAQEMDANLEISAGQWNKLCWYGSVYGHAAKVMDACEKAVELAPEDWSIRDSRALAKALTGNIQFAIEDFQFAIAESDKEEYKLKAQGWLDALQKGENPFTEAVLEGLR